MNPDDVINASAARIINARSQEMRASRVHTCRRQSCFPLCEQDLIDDGRLRPGTVKIDPRVYVCIHKQASCQIACCATCQSDASVCTVNWRGKKIHVCSADRCQEYIGTHEGVCPLTGLYHGHTEGERAYVPPEKRTAHFKKGSSGGGAFQSLRTTIKRDRDEDTSSIGSIPQPAKPVSAEYVLVDVKQEPGLMPIAVPVKVEAQPLTPQQQQHPPKRRRQVSVESRRDAAEAIVCQLLYSDTRKLINNEKRARLEQEKRRAIRSYYADCRGVTFPIWMVVIGLQVCAWSLFVFACALSDMKIPREKAQFDMELKHMAILRRRQERVDRYVDIIMRTWDIVTSSPWWRDNPGLKFTAHALSVLYKMRKGLVIDRTEFLPFDEFLFHLPNRIDLPMFSESFSSSMVTEGMKNLERAYRVALEAGTPDSALKLNF